MRLLNENERPQYRTAKEVFAKLSQTAEYGEKSFFGSYKHPVTKEWQLMVQIYEKGCLYWAEQARFV